MINTVPSKERIVQLEESEVALLGLDPVWGQIPTAVVTKIDKGETLGPAPITVEMKHATPGLTSAALLRKILMAEKQRRRIVLTVVEPEDDETAAWYEHLGMQQIRASASRLGEKALTHLFYASRIDTLAEALQQSE